MSDGLRVPLPGLRPPARRALLPGARGRLPALAALAAAAVGAINILSALTPSLPGRLAVLLAVLPAREVEAAHALALPAGVGLLIAAWFLRARRRRALIAAVGLLAGLGVLDLVKGLDVEEATLSFALAAVLYRGRAAFEVRHDVAALPRALAEGAAAVAAAVVAGFVAVAAAADGVRPAPRPAALVHETLALLALMTGPLCLGERGEWAPAALGALGVATLALVATLLLRPLGVGRAPVPSVVRARVADLVHRHGVDTLSAFKLRGDLRYVLDAGGHACVGYRVVRGVLLIAGDPVGPPEALPGLLADVRAFAHEHGLRVGAVNASAAFRALGAGVGLRAVYLGDEAIVDTAGFGGPARPLRKKVRQAVRRVERAGLRADLRPVAALDQEEVAALAAVAERWRSGAPDRGFSTAMDRLVTQELPDAIIAAAVDAGGRPRGFLHYLPAYGRNAMSLSAMCRDPDTPNGTMEYLLVRSIEMLRERGVTEVSLNFAAFARWLHAPASRGERVLGRIVALADPFFQIESLYRFNAKLDPRWESRYLLHERLPALPRTVLAALSAEGHLPHPRLPRWWAPRRR